MEVSIFTENNDYFIPLQQAKQMLSGQAKEMLSSPSPFDSLLSLCVRKQGIDYILRDDLPFYLRLSKINYNITETDYQRFGGAGNLFAQFLKISEHTAIYLPDRLIEKPLPAFVRNLFYYPEFVERTPTIEDNPCQFDLMGITVITYRHGL